MSGFRATRRAVLAAPAAAGLAGAAAAQSRRRGVTKAFTDQGLGGVRASLDQAVGAGVAPGMVGLIDRDGETQVVAAGALAFGGPPMRRDTLFRIASMTKLFTAAAVMMLVEEGKLRLDEPVDRLLPELADRRVLKRPDGPLDDTVPARRPITVEDLLTFRLGWGIDFNDAAPIVKRVTELALPGFGMPDPTAPITPDQWLAKLHDLPLMAQPGEKWLYTLGSNVQGVLVARASGQSFPAFLEARIFGPLGMTDTSFDVPAGKLSRLCEVYMAENGKLQPYGPLAAALYAKPPAFPAGDSGLVSTVDDLLAFSRMLLAGGTHNGRRLLDPASVTAMTTNHLTPAQALAGQPILEPGYGWGYGMGVATETTPTGLAAGTFGWYGGFGTSWHMDPSRGLTAILLTQRLFDGPTSHAVHDSFEKAAVAALA
jgi:CubicO group peptidase (beta-lactamase class C family)